MSLAPGSRFGAFEITGLIGVGGMGEVYRARDPQLGREVAIKILPERHRLNAEAQRRFEREARLLAALNHPNIATLHRLETVHDAQGLVMELVAGEGLDERIARAPRGRGLPLDDTLQIAVQIAAALEAAHEGGVVHRDLKPANIKIRPDGTVKVLDFGIAKAFAEDAAGHAGATITGMAEGVLGTPAYMSPEQAVGGTADRRADIWAFGCVLYEMLGGSRPFEGDTISQVLARVLEREPDWSRLPASVPARVLAVLHQCLEKDVRKRRRDAGDLRLELEQGAVEPPLPRAATARSDRARSWVVGSLAAAVVAAISFAYVLSSAREEPAPAPEMRLQIATPPTLAPEQFALSPDARYIVFVALESLSSTQQRLYLRALDSTEAHPIPGTDGARDPFWSPDGHSIGFYAAETLYRIDLDGGRPQALARAPSGAGGAWGADGTILFNPDTLTPLFGVAASGGGATAVTQLLEEPHQKTHRYAHFLPDGRHFVFSAEGQPTVSGIYLGSLDGGIPKRLVAADGIAVPFGRDRMMFVQDGALIVRKLDAQQGAFVGESVTLASASGPDEAGIAGFSASANGVLAYRARSVAQGDATTWFDATGKILQMDRPLNGPALSPDNRFLAYDDTDLDGNRDVWIRDLARGGDIRFTTEPRVDGYPIWSPDGEQLIFESDRNGNFDLWIAPVNRLGEQQLFVGTPDQEIPIDWSANGYVLYRRSDSTYSSSDLLAVRAAGSDRTPIVVAGTPFEERMGAFSPDGHWVVYDTNRSGRYEVIVQAFPKPNEQFPISTAGGMAPLWSADGTEIYFTGRGGEMMVARVTTTPTTFAAEKPVQLFPALVIAQAFNQQYAVTGDRRFVVHSTQVDEKPLPITVVLNWKP